MNKKNLSLKQKIDFITNYLYDNFGTLKSELKKTHKNENLYLFDIYFDGIKLRFNFLFCNLNEDILNKKVIILKTASQEELKKLIQLTKTNSFNQQIIDAYTLDILKNKNEIVQLILSIREEKELTNISYGESEIDALYELVSTRNNIQNF